ncbi:cupin domain-containing protein [Patescibacteria group bacterium]|nr:cupin domain-containing protein [Patescibacteria group bacterium]
MKRGYITHIEQETNGNDYFRKVLYTGQDMQLVLMSLKPGEDIGKEIHRDTDQFIRIESGFGMMFINGVETEVKEDDAIIIPAGAEHNLINTGDQSMKLYTLYAPPEHRDQEVHETKEVAEKAHEKDHFNGITTEHNN